MISNFQILQDKIFTWIRYREYCTVPQLVSACKKVAEPYGDNYNYSLNAFYCLAIPLLRVGILEYGIKESKVVIFGSSLMRFILPDGRIVQCNDETNKARFHLVLNSEEASKFQPLLFLQSFPSICSIVKSFPEYDSIPDNFKFYRNLLNMKTQPRLDFGEQQIGMYKQYDYPYVPFCLLMKDQIKKQVPLMNEFLDAINFASCYLLAEQGNTIFKYIKDKKNWL